MPTASSETASRFPLPLRSSMCCEETSLSGGLEFRLECWPDSGKGVMSGDHMLRPRPVARSCICRLEARRRWRSSRGRPQPHLMHFRSMCCSHILCHTTSSSARLLHRWLTWAALHSEVVSRKHRILKDTSGGSAVRKSMRIRSRIDAEMKESWGKQHWVRMPRSMRLRCLDGAAEKSDQTWEMPCWSAWDSVSISWCDQSASWGPSRCSRTLCSCSMDGSSACRLHLRSGRWR